MFKTYIANSLKILILFFFFFSKDLLADFELDYCNSEVSQINKVRPKEDGVLLIEDVSCLPGSPVIVSYNARINRDMTSEESAKAIKAANELLPGQIKLFCNNPEMLKLLSLFNVEYIYKNKDGKFLTKNKLNKSDCKT
jgi:hypothetical protein